MYYYNPTEANNRDKIMKNILNQEILKPVYLMNKSECIEAAKNNDSRTRQISVHFYKISSELLSSYA